MLPQKGKFIFLDSAMIRAVSDELLKLEKDKSVSVVILTGKEGSPSFATGASIPEIQKADQHSQIYNDYFQREWFRVIPNFRKPLIAAINGYALGGGLELAMMADILIASQNAKLGQPEIKLGIIPGAGGTVRLTNAIGKSKAMEMVLGGEPITAEQALKWGLVSQVHPQKDLLQSAVKLAQSISRHGQIALGTAKRAVKNSLEVGETSALEFERANFAALMNTLDKKEGVDAFLNKRKPNFNKD